MFRKTLAILLFAIFVIASAFPVAAQSNDGRIRGVVTDSSGAILPGVTVVAKTGAGQILASAVTDAVGEYTLTELPAGPVRVIFELEGFATSLVALMVQPGVESQVSRRLGLAGLAETVVVVAPSPIDIPPPAPPRPAPMIVPVPVHDRESVCGPAIFEGSESLGTILSRPTDKGTYYIEGNEILIEGNVRTGLEIGRNLVARRTYRVKTPSGSVTAEHTAGLVQITVVGERVSRGVVVYACDEIMKGDFLASFNPEPVRAVEPVGVAAYWDASRILFGDLGQMVGTPRRLMVINRGATSGLRPGQRLTLFRPVVSDSDEQPLIIGDAVIVAVRGESATMRVITATDAVSSGDWAAPQRYADSPSSLADTDPR